MDSVVSSVSCPRRSDSIPCEKYELPMFPLETNTNQTVGSNQNADTIQTNSTGGKRIPQCSLQPTRVYHQCLRSHHFAVISGEKQRSTGHVFGHKVFMNTLIFYDIRQRILT